MSRQGRGTRARHPPQARPAAAAPTFEETPVSQFRAMDEQGGVVGTVESESREGAIEWLHNVQPDARALQELKSEDEWCAVWSAEDAT